MAVPCIEATRARSGDECERFLSLESRVFSLLSPIPVFVDFVMHLDLQPGDQEQLDLSGITAEEIQRQFQLLVNPPASPVLDRACMLNDGILPLPDSEACARYRVRAEAERPVGRFSLFVPASGAASRMFLCLQAALDHADGSSRDVCVKRAAGGDKNAQEALKFFEGLHDMAIVKSLKNDLEAHGEELDALLEAGDYEPVLESLLSTDRLNSAALPKGLLDFHIYRSGARKAFEEQLVESASYVRDGEGKCRLHFTVSPEHQRRFETFFSRVRSIHEESLGVRFEVSVSTQKSSTDTVAVDMEDRPFRSGDGSLLLRPGGHGALLANLDDYARGDGDIVFVKNIDNVVPKWLQPETLEWKTVLVGVLLELQDEIFRHLEALESVAGDTSTTAERLRVAEAFVRVEFPEVLADLPESVEERRLALIGRLDRPLRVCGVVRNQGEPGGGPFWVRDGGGCVTRQIVEAAQVDVSRKDQARILQEATHFNPVDFVCALRDRRGKPYDLRRHVDENAVFIAQKSSHGRELKALERPGLWNGGMAGWNTVFVEVPEVTFNPVKTVNDLLRPEHRRREE